MKFKLIILIIFLIGYSAFSQRNPLDSPDNKIIKADKLNLPDDLPERVSDFFLNLSLKKYEKAYELLIKDSPIGQKKEMIKNLISETIRAVNVYGDNRGYESVDKQQPTPSLIRARYIGIHESYPVRWEFTFYRSPIRGWVVLNIKFDDLSQYFFDDFLKKQKN